MPNPLLSLVLGIVAQVGPMPAEAQVYTEAPGFNPVSQSFVDYGVGGAAEQRWPYDAPHTWTHGYIQHIPAYGGFSSYRPYNWKHVMPQSQTAAGWGMSPQMPYSQQYWHRYQERARNLKDAELSSLPTVSDTSHLGRSPYANPEPNYGPPTPVAPQFDAPSPYRIPQEPSQDVAPPPLNGTSFVPSPPPGSASATPTLGIPYRR